MPETNGRPRAGAFLGTFAAVFFAIAVLFVADRALARLDRVENQAEAQHFYEQGMRAERQRRYEDAVKSYRAALADARENREYRLALARTLALNGEYQEAEQLRREIEACGDGSAPR